MALTTVPASLSATALTLTTAAQPNITSVGTLTGLTVSGNIAGTLTTAAQTNITSLGTLSSLTVTGTSTLGVVDASSFTDVITNTIYTASGNLDIDTVLTGRDVTFTQGSTALMTIKGDASGTTVAGNVGVKVPSLLAFRTNSNEGAIQIGKRGVIFADTGITTHLGNNTYITSANQRVAIENDYGSFYEQYQGKHTFYTTTQAETANSLQTFTTTLQMLQNGNVGIGSDNPGANLVVQRTSQGINQYIYNTSSNQAYINFGNSTTGVYPQDFSSAGGLLVGVDSDETTIVWNGTASDLRFGTSGAGRATIKSNGHFHFFHDIEHNPNSVSGHRYIKLNRTSGYDGHLVFYQSTTPQWQQVTDSSHHMNFYSYQSGAGYQIRFEAGGDLNILDGNLKVAASHGIDFSSSSPSPNTGGSASNNLLDDYEEGTWTPTLLNGGTIHSTSAATYTKVGRLIHFSLYFTISVPNNGGTFAIGGLPYTPNGGSGNYTAASIGYYGSGNLQVAQNAIVHSSSNYIYIHRADGNATQVQNSMMYANGWSSSNGFIVSGCFVHA